MARARARNLLALLAGLLLAGGCSSPVAAQNRPVAAHPAPPAAVLIAPVRAPPPAVVGAAAAAPSAPVSRLWQFKRLYDVDYVDVRAIAERFDLKVSWVTAGRIMQLADARGRIRLKFEVRSRDFLADGIRVFMGDSTVFNQGSLYVSRIDVIKAIVPLLSPAEYAGRLPPPPHLIVLDAGHGGADPGTQNLALHLEEKNLTLDVVLRLKKLLEGRGYQVILTRSGDNKLAPLQRPDLEERDEVANRAKADLFLSVHFNHAVPAVTGTETYVMTPQFETSSGGAKDAVVDKAFPGNQQDFANVVLGYHLHRSLLAGLNSVDRGLKRNRYMVLEFPDCPAALVEAAYLSNNTDASRLATPEFRQRVAQALADGIDAYSAALAALHPPLPRPAEIHPAPASSRLHP
jgi:N-acetylmuramoyl-L-alanine amidase